MPDIHQPEVRVSPDGSKVAVRWPLARTNQWHIVDRAGAAAQEPLDVVDTWQQLVFDPDAESKDYLRRQWASASAKLNTAETKLRHEQQLHGFAQDRIRGLEADIETRWRTANINESVKTELRHRTAEADTYKEAVRDLLAASQQYQLVGLTRLGLQLGFYPEDLDRALENQADEIRRLRAEVEELRGGGGDPE